MSTSKVVRWRGLVLMTSKEHCSCPPLFSSQKASWAIFDVRPVSKY